VLHVEEGGKEEEAMLHRTHGSCLKAQTGPIEGMNLIGHMQKGAGFLSRRRREDTP